MWLTVRRRCHSLGEERGEARGWESYREAECRVRLRLGFGQTLTLAEILSLTLTLRPS